MTFVNSDDDKARLLLLEHSWLQPLPEHEIDLLAAGGKWRYFRKGEMLFHEGQRMLDCLLLESGSIEIFRNTAKGAEKVFGHIKRKEATALAAVFMEHGRFPMNGRACENGCALHIASDTIRDLCMRYPAVSLRLLNIFCDRLYSIINQVDWLTSSSASERLADYLLNLCECDRCPQNCVLKLPLTRMQMAARLGIRQETLCRLMSAWQKRDYITLSGKHVKILNAHILHQLAQPARRSF
jgi:cAMP-binding proteins - catabolite gene activator and regulatory subunit of cAMP-dependent protein kinases